jgi:hypothetical protein
MVTIVKRGTYGWLLEILAIGGLVWALYPLLLYSSIGESVTIPIHFNFSGEADGWGDRRFLTIPPLIALTLYIGMTVLERFPNIYNYPVKVTETNIDALYRLGVSMIRHIKTVLMFIFAYIGNAAITYVDGGHLKQIWVVWVLVGVMFAMMVIYIVRMTGKK